MHSKLSLGGGPRGRDQSTLNFETGGGLKAPRPRSRAPWSSLPGLDGGSVAPNLLAPPFDKVARTPPRGATPRALCERRWEAFRNSRPIRHFKVLFKMNLI